MNEEYRPRLAITMGDAAGSGPEIITKTLADLKVRAVSRPVVVGDAATMQAALEITGVPGEVRAIEKLAEASFREGVIEVIDLHNIQLDRLTRGRVDPMAGKAAYEYIKLATEMALAGEVDAIVTSAINKEALNKAGYHYDGHTQLLAELCGASEVAMMLASGKLRVSHVTTHVSLLRAIELVRPERIITVIRLTDEAIKQMGVAEPRLAVAGLNPHSGEGGLFGDEEIKYITPAIEEARRRGFNVIGPLPPDSVFLRTSEGQFDAAVAMYHDQGHIALKMLGVTEGINITLGLPIIRTSVDHGTNFGKAGKGTADPTSLILSVKLGSVMVCNRRRLSR
ncbi:MAG: 4-hydroxythreonine-4-phosphate dehydrogenase PdxA [Dehalococcoidales bacterium]|jgi:4-hydroxythreonine-4-phosphate dehydrogenase|nr:4-hydroxythreonine-4-phosphate dehydrogenase PdxA [Dehalococcoidales bacterium]MDP6448665.1 4-hydroxythreonine-4-phosphate dehydrogenase PdxA [Dehalococcoidales bacterium]MDP6576563.1 4-hydroxythreonine-4-phosphate dehydrogenase PdxA [Dehalococcoidales bacterium]MDP6824790.1 4-hydroxythreonine-4-phosphate dehydrogenase PdxA [Dehalococcoidales bacterium]